MSLLHFPSTVFSNKVGKRTITSKTDIKVRGERVTNLYDGIQDSDFHKLNVLYRCPGFEADFSKF